MKNQHEIKEMVPLLDEKGNLAHPGYSKHNNFIYNRENISASKWQIKEWNYYQISNGRYMVVLNFFDISFASAITAEICDLRKGKSYTDSIVELFTPNKDQLDGNADEPSHFIYEKFGRKVEFKVDYKGHHLYFKGKVENKKFEIDLFAQRQKGHESLTIATPFEKEGQFFLTQKINCMPTKGFVKVKGKTLNFSDENTFTVMDWGRGVWPYSNYWYWANGTSRINGKLFGFELTWGFGDDSYASETALFYDGKCHKIGKVKVMEDPEVIGYMKPWHFKSETGRLDLIMTPTFDHESGLIFMGVVGMKSHQVHGYWNGYVILDDGTKLEIKNMYAFCEKVRNKW